MAQHYSVGRLLFQGGIEELHEASEDQCSQLLQHCTRPVLVIFKVYLVHRSPYLTQASETRPSRIHTCCVTCKCFPAVCINLGKLHVSCKYPYPSRLSCWQMLIPLQTFQQNVFLGWKSLLARILLMKNGSQWWGYPWNREEKQIFCAVIKTYKEWGGSKRARSYPGPNFFTEYLVRKHLSNLLKVSNKLYFMCLEILQEKTICVRKLHLLSLFQKINAQKYTRCYLKHILAIWPMLSQLS